MPIYPKPIASLLASVTLFCLLMKFLFPAPVDAAEAEDSTTEISSKALYVPFHPDFIVNLRDGTSNFLMVTVQGMSRDQRGINLARHHMAAIRHSLLMLLSEQTLESVRSAEGKKLLMDQALAAVRGLLEKETGEPWLEAVLFTDFVVE